MAVPIVPFVGRSDVGKTTFLEKVIAELKRRDRRVATVKHDAHSFEMDHPGKDTWRHRQAGSDVVVISSPEKLAVIERVDQEQTLDQIAARYIGNVDIILAEGYKRSKKRKIEISRREVGTELLCAEEELLAVVSDQKFPISVPHFGLDDAAGVVDLLEEKVIGHAHLPHVDLLVDGQVVALKDFPHDVLSKGILGMLSALRGIDSPREVQVKIRTR